MVEGIPQSSLPAIMASQNGLKFPLTLWARLPEPADYGGMAFYVPDTPVGPSLVVSDGNMWRIFARNIFTKRITLTAAMAGVAKFDYGSVKYSTPPTTVVTLSDPTKGGRLSCYTQNESITGCEVRVQRGSVLPNLTTGLFGFDPFTGGQTTGVIVNLFALADS